MIKNKTILISSLIIISITVIAFMVFSSNNSPQDLTANVSGAAEIILGDEPLIVSTSALPQKVKVGDILTITAEIQDKHGIEKVSAIMPHERGADEFQLSLISGDAKSGKWQGKWKAHDTFNKEYTTVVTAINILGKSATAEVSWWDDTETTWWSGEPWVGGFLKRKKITITSSTAGAQSNYQVKVTVAYDSDMQNDFDDIRFANANGTLLDHWLESKTDGVTADFWVEIDSIPASPNTVDIYFYYGNPSAASASNSANTFLFFDDFNDGSINPNWSVLETVASATQVEQNGQMELTVPGSIYYWSGLVWNANTWTANQGVSIKWKQKRSSSGVDRLVGSIFTPDNTTTDTDSIQNAIWYESYYSFITDGARLRRKNSGSTSDLWSEAVSTGTDWHNLELKIDSTNATLIYDGTQKFSGAHGSTWTATNSYLRIETWSSASLTGYFDDVLVRKYASPEPSVGTAGSEEVQGTWPLRKKITLSSSTPSANYQVKIGLTTAIMGNPYTNVKTNGDDIRFAQANGTLLDYWIETWNAAGDSTLWVEVATSGTSTIYMYYGNPSASSASNGTNTFEFFDDFSGTSLDPTKWQQKNGGTPSFSGGLLTISANAVDPGKLIAIAAPTGNNYILRAKFKVTAGTNVDERAGLSIKTGTADGKGYNYIFHDFTNLDEKSFLDDGVAWNVRAGSWAKNTWYIEEIFHDGANVQGRFDDGAWQSQAWSGRTGYPALNIGSLDATTVWDWAAVRKYASPEPTTSVGADGEKRPFAPGVSPSGGGPMMF